MAFYFKVLSFVKSKVTSIKNNYDVYSINIMKDRFNMP